MTGLRSIKRSARRSAAAIRGMRSDSGSGSHLWHRAPFIHCQNAPLPSVEQYETWFAQVRSADSRARTPLTGAKLRRAVIMKRGGQAAKDIGRAIGVGGCCIAKWLAKLPPELRP